MHLVRAQGFAVAVLVAMAAAACVAVTHADARPSKRCQYSKASRIRSTDEAVVFLSVDGIRLADGRRFGDWTYFACLRRNGKVTRLLPSGDTNDLIFMRLAGHFAAVRGSLDCGECGGGADEDFRVIDLSTGGRVGWIYSGFDTQPPIYLVNDAALAQDGSFAVIRSTANYAYKPRARRVIYYPRTGRRITLDRGLKIGGHSLRRVGRTYYWRHDGRVRSFTP